MARNLTDRYTTAADVAAELRQILSAASMAPGTGFAPPGMPYQYPGMPLSGVQSGMPGSQITSPPGTATNAMAGVCAGSSFRRGA